MYVIEQQHPQPSGLAGIDHATWAGAADGVANLSVWRQSLAPGAATPPHRHDCDEVVLCLGGEGEVHVGGEVLRFGDRSTVVLPRGVVHQLFNVGDTPLETLGLFALSPVGTFLPDGAAVELPWRS